MSRFRNKPTNPAHVSSTTSKRVGQRSEERGQNIEMTDMKTIFLSESSGLSVHQFARQAGPVHQHMDTDLTAPQSSPSLWRHSLPAKPRSSEEKLKHVHPSQKLVVENSPESKQACQDKKRAADKVQTTSMEILKANADDDDDLDLSSLRDLMESMRQAAREIREITNPVQTSKPKKKEHVTRPRDQKRHHKKKHGQRRSSGHHQQIQAEIHVISEVLGQNVSTTSSDTSQLSLLPAQTEEEHSSPPSSPPSPHLSSPPPSTPPTAFLYVENEELSHTWPRRRGRSVSRQRSMTDKVSNPGTCSEGSSPLVLAPESSLWLQPHQSLVRIDSRSIEEKLTVHKSSRHPAAETGQAHSQDVADFEAIAMPASQPSSRGRTLQRSIGRVQHPASPPPSPLPPHSPTSPPPHIFVSEHDVFQGHLQPDKDLQREPADQEITIDIV